MPNTKINKVKVNNHVYDIDLPSDATPSIASLTTSGSASIGGSLNVAGSANLTDVYIDGNKLSNVKDGSGTSSLEQIINNGSTASIDLSSKNPTAVSKGAPTSVPIGASGESSAVFGGAAAATAKRSLANGTNCVAIGKYSHAEGDNSVALGNDSHAEGYQTVSYGVQSHSEGSQTIAQGSQSHSEGIKTQAIGDYSHAEGNTSISNGANSHAEGVNNDAKGYASHVEGESNKVSLTMPSSSGGGDTPAPLPDSWDPTAHYGEKGHAEGTSNEVIGYSAHAEGYGNKAYGPLSHAEGYNTKTGLSTDGTKGWCAKSSGKNTTASGNYSFATGQNNTVSGDSSFAANNGNTVSGSNSAAFGLNNIITAKNGFAAGSYNIINRWNASNAVALGHHLKSYGAACFGNYNSPQTNSLLEVGYGTADTNRKNAFTVFEDGTAYLEGTSSSAAINTKRVLTVDDVYRKVAKYMSVSCLTSGNITFSLTSATSSKIEGKFNGSSFSISKGGEYMISSTISAILKFGGVLFNVNVPVVADIIYSSFDYTGSTAKLNITIYYNYLSTGEPMKTTFSKTLSSAELITLVPESELPYYIRQSYSLADPKSYGFSLTDAGNGSYTLKGPFGQVFGTEYYSYLFYSNSYYISSGQSTTIKLYASDSTPSSVAYLPILYGVGLLKKDLY